MKEGYLQLKITEFNEKLNKFEETLKFEDSKLQLLQEKVGEYKEVIKKLKDIQDFKTQTITDIRKENEKIIVEQVEQLSKKLSKVLDELVGSKANKINDTLNILQKREEDLTRQATALDQITKDLIFLLEHNDILMMKLVNKGVLSGHDVSEMERRSTKKAHKKD
jgi:hypothetical protein